MFSIQFTVLFIFSSALDKSKSSSFSEFLVSFFANSIVESLLSHKTYFLNIFHIKFDLSFLLHAHHHQSVTAIFISFISHTALTSHGIFNSTKTQILF